MFKPVVECYKPPPRWVQTHSVIIRMPKPRPPKEVRYYCSKLLAELEDAATHHVRPKMLEAAIKARSTGECPILAMQRVVTHAIIELLGDRCTIPEERRGDVDSFLVQVILKKGDLRDTVKYLSPNAPTKKYNPETKKWSNNPETKKGSNNPETKKGSNKSE